MSFILFSLLPNLKLLIFFPRATGKFVLTAIHFWYTLKAYKISVTLYFCFGGFLIFVFFVFFADKQYYIRTAENWGEIWGDSLNSITPFTLSLAPLTVLVVFFFPALYFTPLLLTHSPHHLPLVPPQASSPILPTLHPFHLLSPPLSFLFTFILLEKTHPFALFSLLPCYSVLSFSPLPNSTPSPTTFPFISRLPFYFYFIFQSFLQLLLLHPFLLLLFVMGCSHLVCWNTLLSRGRDQPQPISHMAEYAVCQWCMYAAGGGGATHG